MTRSRTVHSERDATARTAFTALGSSPGDHITLAVHCAAGHHVAAVYRTPAGLLFVGVPRGHGHGDRDRHDAPHHRPQHGPHEGSADDGTDRQWLDWLAPDEAVSVDDPLPAGCECGERTLARGLLLQAIVDGEHRIVLD